MSGITSNGRRGSVVVPNWRWEDRGLDPYALRVAGWIASHTDSYLADYVTRNEIARKTGISAGKVSGTLGLLGRLGIITVDDVPIEQSAGGHRLRIVFNWDVWERQGDSAQPRSPHDRAPVTTRPDPGHHVTSTKGAQEEEQRADRASTGVDGVFEAFWSIYPRKIDKKRALKAYNASGPDEAELLDGVKAWAAYWQREGTDERFIPHAATWLNNGRWIVAPPLSTGTTDEIERLRELMAPHFEAIDVPLPEADTIRVVAKMCAGPGEVAMRFAVAAKMGTSLESAIDVVRSTQDRVTRFKGDPNPVMTGDPVDYTLAMMNARSNVAWRQQ